MANTYTLISSNVLSSNAASVTFSSIPSTYTDLVFRISARSTLGANFGKLLTTFNGQTTYSWVILQSQGSSALSTSQGASSNFNPLAETGSTTGANIFSNVEFYIPSYTVGIAKQVSVFSVTENTASQAFIQQMAALTSFSETISSVTFTDDTANIVAGSSFYLYGIKKN